MKSFDLHQDIALHIQEGGEQTNLDMLTEHIDLVFASTFILPPESLERPAISDHLGRIESDLNWYRNLAAQDSRFSLVEKVEDLEKASTKLLLHVEGLDSIVPETVGKLEEWQGLGLRSAGLVWNKSNAIVTSAADINNSAGLTDFGKSVVSRLNELGVIVDLAHINEQGFYDVLNIATRPPIVSHGNARTLCDHPRNFSDDQLRALAKADGIIGVFFSGHYLSLDRPATMEDVVAHVLHIVEVVGVSRVVIGSDFGGITSGLPQGLESVDQLPKLYARLQAEGLSREDLTRIFSTNARDYLSRHFGNE